MENENTTFGNMVTNPTNKGESNTSEDKNKKKVVSLISMTIEDDLHLGNTNRK